MHCNFELRKHFLVMDFVQAVTICWSMLHLHSDFGLLHEFSISQLCLTTDFTHLMVPASLHVMLLSLT